MVLAGAGALVRGALFSESAGALWLVASTFGGKKLCGICLALTVHLRPQYLLPYGGVPKSGGSAKCQMQYVGVCLPGLMWCEL